MKQLVEDWRKKLATGLTGTALALGSPAMDKAEASHTHQGLAHHQYSEKDIIRSIIGEASNQGEKGMYAIACALRNRTKDPYYKNDILSGVYGKNATHTNNESERIWSEAQKVYDKVFINKSSDITNGATIWGNSSDVQSFKRQSWFKNVRLTKRIGDHYFFMRKSQ